MSDPRIIVALDFDKKADVLDLADRIEPGRCRLKVGKQLFTRHGPVLVRTLVDRGFDIFLDLKYHDIPNTVAHACRAAMDLGVWMMNVHAQGGRRMMEAARQAIGDDPQRPLLVAVTVLTSLAAEDLRELGQPDEPLGLVRRLAALTRDSDLDGVVCSARELAPLRHDLGNEFNLVTPGIRPKGADAGDQRRVMTPAEAIEAGASYLVIGRPVTAASDPMAALLAIEREIG